MSIHGLDDSIDLNEPNCQSSDKDGNKSENNSAVAVQEKSNVKSEEDGLFIYPTR